MGGTSGLASAESIVGPASVVGVVGSVSVVDTAVLASIASTTYPFDRDLLTHWSRWESDRPRCPVASDSNTAGYTHCRIDLDIAD